MLAVALSALALLQPPAGGPADADTRAWWQRTTVLSADSMEGRDTGSRGHEAAARHVAGWLAAAGVQPLGDDGTWYQWVPMEEVAITGARLDVGGRPLRFLHDVTTRAQGAPASLEGALAYRGYCGADALGDVRGKLVVCHAARRAGLPNDEQRRAALQQAGAAGMLAVADPGFTVEPPRWPSAYVRTVAVARATPAPTPTPAPASGGGFVTFSLNADALGTVIEGSGQDAAALVAAGSAGRPLPSFDVRDRLRAAFTTARRTLRSPNVVGILPGTDPAKAGEAIVLTAHLDGYGYGTAVDGDSLYNGTLDDAAYVALIVRLLERREGKGFRRPVIVAIVTGEEKGLLGTRWLLSHLPVPRERIAANVNLDQLRPLFPLELLTVHALDDTSLGDDARAVAQSLGIAVQRDPEPERGLLQRSDHWPFLQAGIPATNFVFGYRPGTESERIYRRWYREGYHTPKDDLAQRIDWKAAADFNRFYYALIERVAGQDAAPAWKPGSTLRR
ncbi:M28 family peptidase [Roseisolibacter sp. H3M3-2]|uniref:M28 family peptidase n=1 Tax=Roseisolibacter sp. H3M3-2 TaxID=3031323 RepID=UPI0023DAFD09|nr:M28 family peptidase [Roseisolibacter sp. H3M3-2]MDF1505031.1 M28 family peptidase [Roseisolibacter sp. H3M3-2]